jgi:hypothetical protein
VRPLRELRPWILVSGASACFGLVAGAVTWAGAVQRRAALAAVAPVLYQEQVDELARLRQLHPTLNYDLDQLTVLNTVPEPATVLGPLAAHVLVQTLVFAAVCSLLVALNLSGRPIWASLPAVVVTTGIVVLAGPLAFLPGTLAGPVTPLRAPETADVSPYVPFAAPLWWRSTVAAAVAALFVAAWRITRRPRRREPALLPMVAALGSLMLILEITLLLAPQTLVPAGSTVTEAAPTAIVLLTLSCCAAVAGCAGSPRRAAARATAPTLLGATACAAAWLVYHRHNPLPPLGWEFADVVPMHWLGTWQLTTLVVSAAGIGVAANAATRALTARPGTGLATARHSARAATQP